MVHHTGQAGDIKSKLTIAYAPIDVSGQVITNGIGDGGAVDHTTHNVLIIEEALRASTRAIGIPHRASNSRAVHHTLVCCLIEDKVRHAIALIGCTGFERSGITNQGAVDYALLVSCIVIKDRKPTAARTGNRTSATVAWIGNTI